MPLIPVCSCLHLKHLAVRHGKASRGRLSEVKLDFARLSTAILRVPRVVQASGLRLQSFTARLRGAGRGRINECTIAYSRWDDYAFTPAHDKLRTSREKLEGLVRSLRREVTMGMAARSDRQSSLATLLNALSPDLVLQRGYALVRTDQGVIVRSYQQVHESDVVAIQLGDGGAGAVITETREDGA